MGLAPGQRPFGEGLHFSVLFHFGETRTFRIGRRYGAVPPYEQKQAVHMTTWTLTPPAAITCWPVRQKTLNEENVP